MQVLVRDNNVDQALKALKKKMQREGIFREMKLRGHYEKPSEKKAREKAEAIRRARKLARKKMQREGLLPMKPRPAPGTRSWWRQRRTRSRRTTAFRLIATSPRYIFKLMLARALSRPRYCFGGHYFQQNFTSASFCLRVT